MEKILSRPEIRLTGWSQPTSSILENDAPFPLYSRRKHPLDSTLKPPSWTPFKATHMLVITSHPRVDLCATRAMFAGIWPSIRLNVERWERAFSIYQEGWISRKQSLEVWYICIHVVLCCNRDWKRVLKRDLDFFLLWFDSFFCCFMDRSWLINFLFCDFLWL